jgi:[protein-PII] uridylyltransferase
VKPAIQVPDEPGQAPGLSPDSGHLATEFLSPDRRSLNWELIRSTLDTGKASLGSLQKVLAGADAALSQRFLRDEPTGELLRERARVMDEIILSAWSGTAGTQLPETALVAVGGYGRGELHPHSDVDLRVLLDGTPHEQAKEPLSSFLTLLWDLGLDLGHSTRTVAECADECRNDLGIVTTLMESRLLSGPDTLFNAMQAAVHPDALWPSADFLTAKLEEQRNRHLQYDDTPYKLEPNVKNGPGCLRDIQTIVWVGRRHFQAPDLKSLQREGLLTSTQLRLLQDGREFLWRVRFALHALTGRREDRLLFDHQARIAAIFGYEDASYMLAVEQLMQRFYRTVMELSRLNEMILQTFQETILMDPAAAAKPLNERFATKNGFLQARNERVFRNHPSALLETFLLLQAHPEIRGVSAATITMIRRDLDLINDEFRQDPRNHRLFLDIIRAPHGVTHELRRMNLYGVLGKYIPAFGRIVGRMQYDLFHTYTVDAHTLFVVSNLRRFALAKYDHELPRCSEIMQTLPSPELAYLAGLFHDIAKGRGGDHSELGAVEAETFCLEHGLSRYDARLVAWLVGHHLLLSLTAQKKDLSDSEVIREFAQTVGDETHLNYLYVLTVADVRGTNPSLWNSWRAQLFSELHALTRQALRRGLENPVDKEELLYARQDTARARLRATGMDDAVIDETWAAFSEDYFLRCDPEEIEAHTQLLADPVTAGRQLLVNIRPQRTGGGNAVFLFTPQETYTFAIATAAFDELGMNVTDARIIPLPHDQSLSTFVILESDGGPISDLDRIGQLRSRLETDLAAQPDTSPSVRRRAPRQIRMFPTQPMASFSTDERNGRTVMELVAGDHPGLLCNVGNVLRDQAVKIETAKIMTVGERAEDVFYITDENHQPLSAARTEQLHNALISALAAHD